jgi:membrane dipeptidase
MSASGGPELQTGVADLHCHFPMHLRETAEEPTNPPFEGMVRQRPGWVNKLRAWLLARAAQKLNYASESGTWRVSLERIRAGDVRVVLSVLYQPFAEMDLGRWPEGGPESGYFQSLIDELAAVERELERLDPGHTEHKVVRSSADLEQALGDGRTAFVHCIEGGFHLGATEAEVRDNVNRLADAGVAYVTLAHLFFRQIAKNAPALPFLSDSAYRLLFWQWGRRALTDLGRAAVEAMYRRRILIDVSHMREDAVADVFVQIEELDRATGASPTDYPVIATHAGFRLGKQSYNLSAETVRRIAARGGVVGVIFAEHQLLDGYDGPPPTTIDDSVAVLGRHITAIAEVGGYECVALGSDLDGFIKPTLPGLQNIDDLAQLPERLERDHPGHAQAILSGNSIRVLETMFARRA